MLRRWISIVRIGVLILLMVAGTGCSVSSGRSQPSEGEKPAIVLPQQENGQNGQSIALFETKELADKDARRYRMYYDYDAGNAETKLVIKQFDGDLHLADLETVFGDLSKLSKDANGNLVGGPIMYKDVFWGVVISPDGQGVNLVTRDADGTLSSAFDLNGDGIADIVDIRLGDGRRFSFLTEELGLRVFDLWIHGKNPLCTPELAKQLGLPDFGCFGTADGSSGGMGGFGDSDSFFGNFDFFGDLCADYSSPLRRAPVMYGYHEFTEASPYKDGAMLIQTQVYEHENGEYAGSIRSIEFFNSEGQLVEHITETLNENGEGSRFVWLPPVLNYGQGTEYRQYFRATINTDGNYNSFQTSPPALPPSEEEMHPDQLYPPDNPYNDPNNPNEGNPNPEDPNAGLAEYCKAREEASRPTGVEADADSDFQVSCSNPADEPYGGCLNIEFADSRDFEGILEVPEGDQGCGAFSTPGDGGICEPATIQQRIRGMIVDVNSVNLADMGPICPPIVCNPAP